VTGIVFDPIADLYERYRTGYSPELFAALEENGACAGARVLDVGCGTALAGVQLVRQGCELVGVDISAPMLDYARKRIPDGIFSVAAAESLPFADQGFDVVIVSQAFHWFDRVRATQEMLRVVRPGGLVAVFWKQIMRGDPMRVMRDEVAQELGFSCFEELVPAHGLALLEESPLVDQKLCVIPWLVTMTGHQYVGYERSRARARAKFGQALDTYLQRLGARLAPLDEVLSLSYVQYLFLGTAPACPGKA
jgi:ubiquinone/menaquinone biosynthesis C-methylase UbiE